MTNFESRLGEEDFVDVTERSATPTLVYLP